MTVCFHYSRPASGQSEGEVYGLDVAVNNLLTAWFRHGTASPFICRPTDIGSFDHFKTLARKSGVDPDTRCLGLDPRHPALNLEGMTCLFRPDPLISDIVWQRQQLQGRGFVACGLVHTMSGERIARAVGELCLAPTDGCDALICPSEAIRDAVQSLWGIQADYLNHRFGGDFACPVRTPVIPLGIDTEKFKRLSDAALRAGQRQALGADEQEIVILFVGRLSFATKAHPLALWLAAERAAQRMKRKLRVVMYGYFKPKDMEQHFRNLAADIGRTVRIDFVRNDDPRFPDGLWAGADIFASLSDNVQESFGLTPVEAMAAGLPVVASDWNGYKGSIRDGLEGFLIPTLGPPPQAGMDLARTYFNQGNYGLALMGAAQSTAVDIERCTAAFRVLGEDDARRRSMGENGRARARAVYDWQHVIAAYEQLWKELAHARQAAPPRPGVPSGWPAVHPAFPNPFHMFGGFPTVTLQDADRLLVVMKPEEIATLLTHDMNYFVPELLAPKGAMPELIEAVRRANVPSVKEVLAIFPGSEHPRIWRCLGWMLKHGVCVKR